MSRLFGLRYNSMDGGRAFMCVNASILLSNSRMTCSCTENRMKTEFVIYARDMTGIKAHKALLFRLFVCVFVLCWCLVVL